MNQNKPRPVKSKHPHLTIGALTVEGHIYNKRIWSGIVEVAKKQDINLIGFNGLPMQAPGQYNTQANIIYNLINDKVFDGLLINSSSVFNYISLDETIAFLNQYGSLPMVSIGVALPGIPSIVIDNYKGLYDLVVHLIVVHGRRRIAVINGPEYSVEAQVRHQAYVDALTHHNLVVDANLMAPGEFYFRSGMSAIELLIDHRKEQFDAIVAASDDIALGALEGLRIRGIHVPEDVSVIGFDNNPQNKYSVPPLTTVNQSIEELGSLAATKLLMHLNGEELPLVIQVPTTPVIRQSCGCPSPQVEQVWVDLPGPLAKDITPAYATIPQLAIVQAMTATFTANRKDSIKLASQVLEAFLSALAQENPKLFTSIWSRLLRQALYAHEDFSCWQEALSIMRRELLPFVENTNASNRSENLWHQAQVLLLETVQQAGMLHRTQESWDALVPQEVNETLLMTFNMTELLDLLTDMLQSLGIKSYYLNLYEKQLLDEPIEQITDWSHLILAYDEEKRILLPARGLRFPSRQLVPDTLLSANRPREMLVMPLFVQETQLGYGLFELFDTIYPNAVLFNLLRNQISNGIYGALLFQQAQQTQTELKKRVEERTQELEVRNAELERFTYTVSHDLKSPLITIQGFLGFLERDAMAGDIVGIQEDIARISDATNRMRILLEELLELSRVGRLMNPPELIPLAELLEEAISLVAGRIKACGVQVVMASNLPAVYGDRRRLVEVMQNLLDNAAKFMGQQAKPRVEIGARTIEDEVMCYVRDNGVGILPQYHETIFGLFDRLDPSIEGTGIGLAVVKRIIEVHNGRIWVESEGNDRGTCFYFTLPTKNSV
jgi:DNA-binding LacI/PurR family transcriptional regulator/signal transduction histidine kinase